MARYAKFFSVGGGGGGTNNLQLPVGTVLDTTLRQVQDGLGTGSSLYLSTGGLRVGTTAASAMYWDDVNSRLGIGTNAPVGILHLYKSAAATRLAIDGDAGQNRLISYRTGALQRFGLYVNNTAESGSNAGSDFAIRAYNDAGTLLNTPVFIKRSTGNVGIGTTTPVNLLSIDSTNSTLPTEHSAAAATIKSSVQSPLRVLRTGSQPNIWIGTSSTNPNVSSFLFGIRTGAYYNTATPTYSGDYAPWIVSRGNDWGTATSASDLRMSQIFTVDGNTGRAALAIYPSLVETATNTDIVNMNNLLIATRNSFSTLPLARLQIIGDGQTSGTTSLLVQNSSGSDALIVRDDLNVLISAAGIFGFGDTTNYAKKSSAIDGVEIAGFGGVGLGAFGGINTFVVRSGSASLGATTANASAIFDITSTTKGFLPPRMTTAQKNAIASPANGLMVYDTDLVRPCFFNGATWITL